MHEELKHAVWRTHPSNLRQLEPFAQEGVKIPVDRHSRLGYKKLLDSRDCLKRVSLFH